MRVDKFLKLSRLIKRRTVAKEVASQGRIELNGRPAKASTELEVGDELRIRFGHTLLTIRIDRVTEQVRKGDASSLYTVVNEEKVEQSQAD
ncbi:RNA-binding S4 domain-containing protein [Aquisalibacillus elongatus]|uniref:RQC P-site tRNA stabilizing factor n=1 Tax=Aquisalibacillus elongatus TaxID=485577 RepID=A0A3N5B240_9BACI|nr:RNA-binding S4 domain-containing protein [Aquisalibacillus elongatus]RPF51209.1 ribosomal 50S subunit-recycling heat shock protein [Aquisalibacillus elongatus]